MKKTLFMALTAIVAICLSAQSARAQMQQIQQFPVDSAVLVGHLDNGMTYYIRHNAIPEGRAEFYLATNVGAIQETPDQDGLAHFLEHMCFNGTKNFPGKGILDWLQSIGASFGGNVNASTGVEQTQYMLNNIPLVRETVIDTCLLIMHDYSHFVTNSADEIDKERGVIVEERRQRRNAAWRLHEASLPYLYKDCKYATCTLIGSEDNLWHFKPESLHNFYKTWYRPDLQALIVVGDVDPKSVEQKIRKIFADIPAAENPKAKDVIPIPGNKEPIVGILTDPEKNGSDISIYWKRESMPEEYNNTVIGMLTTTINDIVSLVMDERFTDIEAKSDAPFISANLGIGNITESNEVTLGSVRFADGKADRAFSSFMNEIERLRRYGITAAEYQRAKDNILSAYESAANSADTRTNASLVPGMIQHFFDNQPLLAPADEYELMQQIFQQISKDVVNQYIPNLFGDEDIVILYEGAESAPKPSENELTGILAAARTADIEAPKEEESNVELLDKNAIKGGKVKKTENGPYDSKVWTLSNGVVVVAKQSSLEKDAISIHLRKDGGESLVEDADMPSFNADIISLFLRNSGVSRFSASELSKALAGKNASASPYFNDTNHGIDASSTRKDLETAFQLLYLNFVDPRFDQTEYDQGINQIKAILPTLENNPQIRFTRRFLNDAMTDPARNAVVSAETLEKANLQTIERYWRNIFFKDAAGARVYIVGDFDFDTLKGLCEKYLGALPKGKKATTFVNRHDSYKAGAIVDVFEEDMETPQTTVYNVYSAPYPFSVQEQTNFEAISYIMDMVYTESLREEEGGTYGASTQGSLEKFPEERGTFLVAFNCRPSTGEKLRQLAKDGLRSLAENGPTDEQFGRTVENFKKMVPEQRSKNDYWLTSLNNYYVYGGVDIDAEYEKSVANLSKEGIQATLKKLLASGNIIEVVMNPGKTAEAE